MKTGIAVQGRAGLPTTHTGDAGRVNAFQSSSWLGSAAASKFCLSKYQTQLDTSFISNVGQLGNRYPESKTSYNRATDFFASPCTLPVSRLALLVNIGRRTCSQADSVGVKYAKGWVTCLAQTRQTSPFQNIKHLATSLPNPCCNSTPRLIT